MPELVSRITGLEYHPARALQDHRGNWRRHGEPQRAALRGLLAHLGIAGALLVYDSARQGGLTVIDGHLRKTLYPDEPWPCLMTDLDDAEADVVLLTYDFVAYQAGIDRERLGALAARVDLPDPGSQVLLAQLRALASDPGGPPALETLEDTYGPPGDADLWPQLRLRLPPATYERYRALLSHTGEADEVAGLATLLQWAAQGEEAP